MSQINISVVIPVYNSSKTIQRALNSVLVQTVKPTKIVIVNDQSTDNTLKVIENYIKNNKTTIEFQLITLEKNSGPSKARNTGWNNANTEYIAFLDSDDSWHPQKLEVQYNFMKKNIDIKLSGHLMKLSINNEPNIKQFDFTKFHFKYITSEMQINKNYFTTTSNIIIKNDTKLRFDENMRYAEDYYLWLQFCFEYKVVLLNHNLGFAYKDFTGVSGLSGNILAMYKGSLNIYKILLNSKKITLGKYSYLLFLRTLKLFKAVLKKYSRKIYEK